MAEATLNDVSNAIREDGNKDREQLKGDSIRQFLQLRSSNKLLKSLTQAQIDSNEQMKKQFEQQQEALRRENAKKALGEPANDNETRSQRIISSLIAGIESTINVLERIKKALPNKKTAFGLLFGGLAAAFAFFPEWSKRNVINPLIDVINVFRDKDYTTTLGRVVYNLKEGLGWISDNFGEEAAWVTGILGTVAALHPITTLKIAAATLKALPAIAAFLTMPWIGGIVGIAALLASAKLGLDMLRELSIESETELSKKALSEYKKAVKDENQDEIDRIVAQQSARLKRNQDTTLKGIESIEGPINEILKLNVKAAEVVAEQARIDKLAAAIKSDTLGGEDGSIDKRINEANNTIANSFKQQVLAITKGKAPDKDAEAEIYKLLKESIEQNDTKETKAVIRGIKDALPAGKLKERLALLNSTIKRGQNIDKMMEQLNLALKGLVPEELKIENVPVGSSEYQERIKTMYEGFDETGNNQRAPIVPVVAPVTNNSDNKKTINYTYYNVFTDSNLNPATGRYENGVVPTYM